MFNKGIRARNERWGVNRRTRNTHGIIYGDRWVICSCCPSMHPLVKCHRFKYGSMQKGRLKFDLMPSEYSIKPKPIKRT